MLRSNSNLRAKESGLQGAGHSVNLVIKAIINRTDVGCINYAMPYGTEDLGNGAASQFRSTLRSCNEIEVLVAWQKNEPVGVLHSPVLPVRSSTLPQVFFLSKR